MMKSNAAALKGEARYEKVCDLYEGADGCIKLCADKLTGEKVAIKYVARGPKIDESFCCGIMNHVGLLHQHIVTFKEVFLTSEHLCVVTEYASGGDVLELIRTNGVNEDQARWLFQQLMIALDYCHNMGIICSEIKLENALLDSNSWPLLKMNAFRFSRRMLFQDTDALMKPRGNPAYLSPELIDGRALPCAASLKAMDVWNCGIFLYAMLFRSYPFCHAEDRKEPDQLNKVLARTMECEFSFPEAISVSNECKDLIRRILKPQKQRITLDEITQHPWFVKDLPQGALNMNQSLRFRKGTRFQSKADIESILDEAKSPSPTVL